MGILSPPLDTIIFYTKINKMSSDFFVLSRINALLFWWFLRLKKLFSVTSPTFDFSFIAFR